jgi:hypothetical protein
MRQVRFVIALAVVVGALAMTASAALANGFVVQRSGQPYTQLETKGGSGTAGEQQFSFGAITVRCDAAKSTGIATPEKVLDSVKFEKCAAEASIGGEEVALKAIFKGPVELGYTSEEGADLASGFAIQLKAIKCTIDVEPGEDLEYAYLENEVVSSGKLKSFPSGLQHKLRFENELGGIAFHSEGQCEAFANGDDGTYSGTLWDEVVGGDLAYSSSVAPIEGGWNRVKNTEDPGGGSPII